jgi:hypothetical protein
VWQRLQCIRNARRRHNERQVEPRRFAKMQNRGKVGDRKSEDRLRT